MNKCFSKSHDKVNVVLLGDSHAAHYVKTFKSIEDINLMYATFSNFGKENCLYDSVSSSPLAIFLRKIYETTIPEISPDIVIISCRWTSKQKSDAENTLSILKNYNLKIIGQSREYDKSYPDIWDVEQQSQAIIRNKYLKSLTQTNIDLKSWFGEAYIDIYDLPLVDTQYCLHMSDDNHLTKCGADQVIKQIGPLLFNGILKFNLM